MTRLAALVLCLSLSALAADDAPLVMNAGDVAPVKGVLLPDALAIRSEAERQGLRAENAELKKAVQAAPTPVLVVVLVVGSVVVAGAAGFGIGYAAAAK
jgi:hypothetical protein